MPPTTGDFIHEVYDNREQEEESINEEDEVLVELDNIHKTYLLGIEGVPALRGVSLKIRKGEWVVVYGTSGGGKTTLLNLIGTIDKPTKGEMVIGDQRVTSETHDDVLASIRLNTLGFVFQSFNLLTAMTAQENVELPMILKGELPAWERKVLAEESLEKMGLGHRTGHYPNMLSGGEQQRVTIARAVANKPKLLLLDEPTGDLDTKNTRMVVRMLRKLNEENDMTLIMVTHDVHLKNFAKRIIWMRDGKILRTESVDQRKRLEAFKELEEEDVEDVSNNEKKVVLTSDWSRTEIRRSSDYKIFQFKPPSTAASLKAKA